MVKKPDKSGKVTAKQIKDYEKKMKNLYNKTEIDRDNDNFTKKKGK